MPTTSKGVRFFGAGLVIMLISVVSALINAF